MSFDNSLPAVRDRIRLQVGDTSNDEATELFPDETYDAYYAYHGNDETRTLIAMAEALIAKFSQSASRITLGDMGFSWRDRLTAWQGIIKKFQGVISLEVGGGFQILRPQRDEIEPEYERPYTQEAWWNGGS